MTPSRTLPKPTSMLGCQYLKGLVDFIFKNLKERGGMVPAVDNAGYEREVVKKNWKDIMSEVLFKFYVSHYQGTTCSL